jgi:hypothetical protein
MADGFPENSLSYIGASAGDKRLPRPRSRLWPGPGPCDFRGGQTHACQLLAILLLMHNGFGYIYDNVGLRS